MILFVCYVTSATLKQVLKPKSAKKDKQVVGRNSSSTDRGCANWYCMSNCVVPEISVVIAVRGRAKGNRYYGLSDARDDGPIVNFT